ncbi:MAG: Calx-beta domain-containing protein, partial [Methylococcaceae bacterium]
ISRLDIQEGNSGSKNGQVLVNLSSATSQTVTVNYSMTNGTATAGTDYITRNSTLIFAPGVKQQSIPVTVLGDTVTEPDENFFITLSGAKNASISTSQSKAEVLITNDDLPTVSINSVAQIEGSDGNTKTFNFTVKLPAPLQTSVSVDYRVLGGTATENEDFFSSAGTLVFAPGQVTQTIPVTVLSDTRPEGDETFTVQLANPKGVALDPLASRGTGTIQDDDLSVLSITNATLTEGNSATQDAVLTVNLSAPATQTVTVNYTTTDGTANASSDYITRTGTLSFAPGTSVREIRVPIIGDTKNESDENFSVVLSNPKNASLDSARYQASVTIINDDVPLISIANTSAREGNAGDNYQMEFAVNLSSPSTAPLSVDYRTVAGTALENDDFIPISSTLNFAPGEQTQTILIPLVGDNVTEPTETFKVQLENPQGAVLDTRASSAVGTINDDDVAEVYFTDINPQVIEGNPSDAYTADLTVELSSPSTQTVSVNYSVLSGTAKAGSDFIGSGGVLVFQPGTTSQTLSIPITGDQQVEADEDFSVQLTTAKNANINPSTGKATVTIINDDLPVVSIAGTSVQEGNFGTNDAVLTLSLSAPSAQPINVSVFTQDDTAMSSSDYLGFNQSVYFAPGTVSQTVRIPVFSDTLPEADERFGVYLRDASNAEISDTKGQATVVVLNDDTPQIKLEGVQITEGNSGTTNAVLRVSLSDPSDKTVTVKFSTSNGTALAGSDYSPQSGTVSFAPGTQEQQITIPIIGDTQQEPDETFNV